VEKLSAAGITTVEALADMTPEQLEAIEGIGPKTVEKISLAVNNYFSSLEGGEVAAEGEAPVEGEAADAEAPVDAEASGENPELAAQAEAGIDGETDEAAPSEGGDGVEAAALEDTAEIAPETGATEEEVEPGKTPAEQGE
jgi:N utilization substance protein A